MKNHKIDWEITIIPAFAIFSLAGLFFVYPRESNRVLGQIREILGDILGSYYLLIGVGIFSISLFLAFSKYGNIVLGKQDECPQYSFWTWGAMMFTCGLAADILFYSFSEWILYATDPHIAELGPIQDWAGVFSLFHWGFIPWAFYLVLATAFGFMLHVRNHNRQKFSEACRPLLGNMVDGWIGKFIDLFAVFALLAGTATTFSVATPLMSAIIETLTGIYIPRIELTIGIIIITCIVYTYSLIHGIRGISYLSNSCMYLFFGLLVFVWALGGESQYIIETGLQSFGMMMNHFIELATYTDPLRTSHFPQNWTIYYWSYWMVWSIASPFFIGKISRGRTIRQLILGGYVFGVGSTCISFIVLGNYSMGLQMAGKMDFVTLYQSGSDIYDIIIVMVNTMPFSTIIFAWLIVTMIAFYATSFDSIALVASCYSYRMLANGEYPSRKIEFIWCILLIILPIALLFSESSMANIQSVSIIAAFPLGIIMAIIVISFMRDARGFFYKEKAKHI
ncbi:BCCT family transporter [Mitsuokella sp.]